MQGCKDITGSNSFQNILGRGICFSPASDTSRIQKDIPYKEALR